MGLDRRYGSGDIVIKASPSSSKKIKSNTDVVRSERSRHTRNASSTKPQAEKMGPLCKSRKEAATIFPVKGDKEDVDLDKQLQKETQSDDFNSMWLSSNCMFPLSVGSNDFYVDDWLVSWLLTSRETPSLMGKQIMIHPVEDAFLVFEKTISEVQKSLHDDSRDGGDVITRNDVLESSMTYSESTESSPYALTCEDFMYSDAPSTPFSTHLDSPSLVNLHGEVIGSELSLRSSWSSEVHSCVSSVSSFTEVKHEVCHHHLLVTELDDVDSSEPIFWPFQQELNWDSDLSWDCFCMSPRRDMDEVGTSATDVISTMSRPYMPLKGASKSLFGVNSETIVPKALVWEQRSESREAKQIDTKYSRSRKPTESKSKTLRLEMKHDNVDPSIGVVSHAKLVEMDFKEHLALSEEVTIEALLGLDEFDGHVGIDSEYNKDDFSLHECL